MAGIGFELRRILKHDNYFSLLGAYGYAGIITSGPWLLAIFTILILSFEARLYGAKQNVTEAFQVIVLYCIAGSLILSSFFQHSYTRYIADQFYLRRQDQIVPSLNGLYSAILLISGILGYLLVIYLLPDESYLVKLITLACFITACLIWVTTSVLSGLLAYKTIFFAFFSNFLLAVVLSYILKAYKLEGLLFSFLAGQFLLLMILIYTVYKSYPMDELINFKFFNLKNTKLILFFTGFFYNLGVWVDKFIFWFSPSTGSVIVGKLHGSLVYDTPIFLAYLSIVPGTIIFLMRMETDYAFAHENLYRKINGNFTLEEIVLSFQQLLHAGRRAILSIIKSQAYVLLIGITIGGSIFASLNISYAYFHLYCVCLLGASLNIIFWATIDIIFYLDKIYHAFFLTLLFVISNTLFTWLSILMGVYYFGYGLVFSLLLTVVTSFFMLNRELSQLIYQTYVFAPVVDN